MHAVHLPVLAAAIVLVGSGLNKIWHPAPTARALRQLVGPRVATERRVVHACTTPAAVRGLGAVEVIVGGAVLASTWAVAVWALAALYVGFTAFVVVALATGAPLQSCGCFGAADSPPSARHVAIDAGLAALAVAAVTDASLGAPRHTLGASHGAGALLALVTAAVVWLLLRGRVRAGADALSRG